VNVFFFVTINSPIFGHLDDGEGAKTSEKELFEFRIKLSQIASLYVKPYFGLNLSLLGTVLSSALDARCGAPVWRCQIWTPAAAVVYGYRCLLQQPTLCVGKECRSSPHNQASSFYVNPCMPQWTAHVKLVIQK
jgi:hypothetical protein